MHSFTVVGFIGLLIAGIFVAEIEGWAGGKPDAEARAIRAEVLHNDVAVFTSSTSDNGHPNVDEVWAYLPGLKFQPTEAYLESLKGAPLGSSVSLKGENNKQSIGLSISYGGRAWLRDLTLEEVGDFWRISQGQVEKYAPYRWIQRRAVDDLCKAKARK